MTSKNIIGFAYEPCYIYFFLCLVHLTHITYDTWLQMMRDYERGTKKMTDLPIPTLFGWLLWEKSYKRYSVGVIMDMAYIDGQSNTI